LLNTSRFVTVSVFGKNKTATLDHPTVRHSTVRVLAVVDADSKEPAILQSPLSIAQQVSHA
jgi:hypothetical protein